MPKLRLTVFASSALTLAFAGQAVSEPVPYANLASKPHPPASPVAIVTAANRAAVQEPTTLGYLNAIQIYPFMEGAVYHLYTAPEKVCDIALQPGEQLIAISAGDTARWVIGDTYSGGGATKQSHILVKPFTTGLKTNLVVTTDKRTYHLQLESTSATSMAAISWTYPQEALIAVKVQAAKTEAEAPVATGISVGDLHFGYVISGDAPSWRPLRVFDDSQKTYIEFPPTSSQGEAPPLFVVGADGKAELLNYRIQGHFYVADRLFDLAELRLGTKPQSIVRITRSLMPVKPSGWRLFGLGGGHD